jgi:hypothetical protein
VFVLRHIPSRKFFRMLQGVGALVARADSDLNGGKGLLSFDTLWDATQFTEHKLKGQPVEIVELELREMRVIPPVIDIEAQKNEIAGNQLPEPSGV